MTPTDLTVREIHAEKITLVGSTATPESVLHLPGAGPTESWSTTIAPGHITLLQKNSHGVDFESTVKAGQMSIAGPFHKTILTDYQLHLGNEHESMSLSKTGLVFSGKEEVLDAAQGLHRRNSRVEIVAVDEDGGRPIDRIGNGLSVYDAKGKLRARLGRMNLQSSGGSKTQFPESTLTMFDQEGRVELQLPRR